jgi:hypothetical protein
MTRRRLAKTNGGERSACQAVQYGDTMTCQACGMSYDTNDPDPPYCRTGQDEEAGKA